MKDVVILRLIMCILCAYFMQLAGLSENACLTMCRPRSSKSAVGGSEQSSSSSATVEDQLNTAEACSQQQQQPGVERERERD